MATNTSAPKTRVGTNYTVTPGHFTTPSLGEVEQREGVVVYDSDDKTLKYHNGVSFVTLSDNQNFYFNYNGGFDLDTLTVGTQLVVTIAADLDWQQGLRGSFIHNIDNYFTFSTVSYDKETGELIFDVESIKGSGVFTAWSGDIIGAGILDGTITVRVEGIFDNWDALQAHTFTPALTVGQMVYLRNAQGLGSVFGVQTPGWLGGTYYPAGYYSWDGSEFDFTNEAIVASINTALGQLVPINGTTGYVLAKTDTGFEWADPGSTMLPTTVVITNPTASQKIIAPDGTQTIIQGDFDILDDLGSKILDVSGGSGDFHVEDGGNVKLLFDRSSGKFYYDSANTGTISTSDANEIATIGDLVGLQVVRITANPQTVPFRAVAWISNTESYINDTGISVGNVTTSTTFGTGWLRIGGGGGSFTLHEGTDSNNAVTFQRYYLSSDGGTTVVGTPIPVGADEIVATTIQRNSAGQDLAEWEAADPANNAGNFVVDSTQAETFVALARDEDLLNVVRETKMEVATENGNNYHYDLLRFIALNGRLVLQTDNLVAALADKQADLGLTLDGNDDVVFDDKDLILHHDSEIHFHDDQDMPQALMDYDTQTNALEILPAINNNVTLHVSGTGKAFVGPVTVPNNEIATIGDLHHVGFTPDGANLFTISNLFTGNAGTAPGDSLYFRTSASDNTKLTITNFSQLVAGNQILFDLPDGSLNTHPALAVLAAVASGGTIFISTDTGSAEIAITGVTGSTTLAAGNKRFTIGSVTQSFGTVSTDASTSFNISNTAAQERGSFVPSAESLQGLRLGSEAATTANRATIVLGYGSLPANTVELTDSGLDFAVVDTAGNDNAQYIHLVGSGGDLGFDITGLDNKFAALDNTINSIVHGGSGQSTFEFPDDNPAFITNVLVDETRFTNVQGGKSTVLTNVDTAAPLFNPNSGHLTLIYSNLTDTEITQLQAAIGNDLAFRTTVGGIVTTGNVENADGTAAAQKTYHFDFRSVDYRLGTGRRQLDFVLRDLDEAADFATAFSFLQNTGVTGSANFLYIPTDGPLVTNLIDNIALVTRVDVSGGGGNLSDLEVRLASRVATILAGGFLLPEGTSNNADRDAYIDANGRFGVLNQTYYFDNTNDSWYTQETGGTAIVAFP